jgi:hypothetical protein
MWEILPTEIESTQKKKKKKNSPISRLLGSNFCTFNAQSRLLLLLPLFFSSASFPPAIAHLSFSSFDDTVCRTNSPVYIIQKKEKKKKVFSEMDPFTLTQVNQLFARLQRRLLVDVILRLAAKEPFHPTFDLISRKLAANSYATAFDFALDVRLLFTEARRVALPDQVAVLAIADLSNWFESHLHKLPRSRDEELSASLNRAKRKIQVIRRAMALFRGNPGNRSRIRTEGHSACARADHYRDSRPDGGDE